MLEEENSSEVVRFVVVIGQGRTDETKCPLAARAYSELPRCGFVHVGRKLVESKEVRNVRRHHDNNRIKHEGSPSIFTIRALWLA